MARRLTRKQQRFVEEYLVDLNGTQAAIRAGYSPKTAASTATENLRKPKIVAAVAAAIEQRRRRTQIDQDFVVRGLVENYERAMQAVPVTLFGKIVEGEWTWQGTVANRALELLGKHLGMFAGKRLPDQPPEEAPEDISSPEDAERYLEEHLGQTLDERRQPGYVH